MSAIIKEQLLEALCPEKELTAQAGCLGDQLKHCNQTQQSLQRLITLNKPDHWLKVIEYYLFIYF